MNNIITIKRNTAKLWTLIIDRDVSSDFSEEFKNLVESGVEAILSDTYEDKNTANHFAVAKKDKKNASNLC